MGYSARPFLLVVALFAVFTLACGVCSFGAAPFAVEPAVESEEVEEVPQPIEPGQESVEELGEDEAALPVEEEGDVAAEEELVQSEPVELLTEETVDVAVQSGRLVELYEVVTPGVVAIGIQTRRGGGSGSGFIINREEGYIITNHHVVAGAQGVIVTFFNGLQGRAEVIGTDNDSDLAVIRVDTLPEEVRALDLADSSEVRPGQPVVAIGNPFGQQGTMTYGIVSAVGRTIASPEAGFNIPLAIQTDAPINPGNSGGPLLNLAGQVIGVNSQIYSPTGAFAGIGYAVPSNIVAQVAPVLIERGQYVWPWLGVSGIPVSLSLAEILDLPVNQGAYITEVISGGPADQAGLRGGQTRVVRGLGIPVGGDVIVAADGEPIRNWEDLLTHIAFVPPGDVISLTIIRDGEEVMVDVELGERPDNLRSEQQVLP